MNGIVNYILQAVLGPANYYRGLSYLKTIYDIPYLSMLLETISKSDFFGVPVVIDTDVITKGMEELNRILDASVDSYNNISEEQKLSCKCGNQWFVESCNQYIMSRCKKLKR